MSAYAYLRAVWSHTYGRPPKESSCSFRLLGDLWSGELAGCSDLTREVGVFLEAIFLEAGVFGIKPSILNFVSFFS